VIDLQFQAVVDWSNTSADTFHKYICQNL